MGLGYRIEVDGGIDLTTVADVVRAGAEILVAGNAIFGKGDPKINAREVVEDCGGGDAAEGLGFSRQSSVFSRSAREVLTDDRRLTTVLRVSMSRRIPVIFLLGVLAFAVGCTNKKVNNPLSNVGSKQPDKVLFDRAMDAMKHNRFDVARITLQTLINTYPDSEYIARAKLAVADSWYAEGGATSLTQAEIEYKDFETFFPNMPEAAEAQLKIANIHYQQMEKPDRDYTHAMRAEEEYRQLILQYPGQQESGGRGQEAPDGSAGSDRGARVPGRTFLLSAPVLSGGHRAAAVPDGQVSSVQQGR